MAKKLIAFEAEGGSLAEARENLVPQFPDGHEIIEEEILEKGKRGKKRNVADTIGIASSEVRDKLPLGTNILEEKVLQEPKETFLAVEAFNEKEAAEKAKSKAGRFIKILEVTLKTAGKRRFFGLRRSPYRVKIFKRAVVEITYQKNAKIRVSIAKKRKKLDQLYCTKCGNTQFHGEWEKLMDEKAKALGSRGFFNISARPQCLSCGGETLLNISESKKYRRTCHKERKDLRKIRSTPEFAELVKLSKRINFPASTAREKSMVRKVKNIGERIAEKSEIKFMVLFIRALPSSTGHDRLWRDFVSASWNGIEDSSGNFWMH